MDKPLRSDSSVLVRTLGPLHACAPDGADLTPRTRKARALLALLAIESRPVSRERIADLLWSSRGPEQARSSVRQALFELRHGDDGRHIAIVEARDGLSIDGAGVATDLEAIATAARSNKAGPLVSLLSSSERVLLPDLDGLDPEYDGWLRQVRATEPERTLAGAVACGQRLLERGDAKAAGTIAAEVLRIEPTSEEASRLAMRTAHDAGDAAALHRHYARLRTVLGEEFGAQPSSETRALFAGLTSERRGAAAPVHSAFHEPETLADPVVRATRWPDRKVAAAMLFAGLSMGAVLVATTPPSVKPSTSPQLPLVAVIPFDELPVGDGALAEGLWDDVRLTLSRAQAVRVLGRTTSQSLATQNLSPADYRQRLGVDYLLDGGVRREGDRVRVNVSLVRAADGVAVWEQAFEGRLGDPFALQGAIANGIEGRIRGRLAPGGGRRADQIKTTPEVYALYSKSRHLILRRTGEDAVEALRLLDRAIKIDPNFAPAWALSASAEHFAHWGVRNQTGWRQRARFKFRRAIELAPQLAEAYASSALINGFALDSSRKGLERAVKLDPGNAEAWLWLGNAYATQGRFDKSIAAYERSIEIDPFLGPALSNLAQQLIDQGRSADLERVAAKLTRAGAGQTLAPAIRAQLDYARGDYSTGVARLLPLQKRTDFSPIAKQTLWDGLVALGLLESAAGPGHHEDFADIIEGRTMPPLDGNPADVLLQREIVMIAARTAMAHHSARQIVDLYHRGYRTMPDFIDAMKSQDLLPSVGPSIAALLRSTGSPEDRRDAALLVNAAAEAAGARMASAVSGSEQWIQLARIRSVQGRSADTLAILERADRAGWIPDGFLFPSDIAMDPALAALAGQPRFEAVRVRILARIARERRELGPLARNLS